MNKIILGFIGGVIGYLIGLFTKSIIIKSISFIDFSGKLGSLFSSMWIIILILAGVIISLKMGFDN